MPTQDRGSRDVPLRLCLDHEQEARDDETRSTEDLRDPIDPVFDTLRHLVVDAGQRCEARDPKHRSSKQLREGGEKAKLVQVMGFQVVPRRPPGPSSRGIGPVFALAN